MSYTEKKTNIECANYSVVSLRITRLRVNIKNISESIDQFKNTAKSTLSKPGYLRYIWECNFKQTNRYYVCIPFAKQADINTIFTYIFLQLRPKDK